MKIKDVVGTYICEDIVEKCWEKSFQFSLIITLNVWGVYVKDNMRRSTDFILMNYYKL